MQRDGLRFLTAGILIVMSASLCSAQRIASLAPPPQCDSTLAPRWGGDSFGNQLAPFDAYQTATPTLTATLLQAVPMLDSVPLFQPVPANQGFAPAPLQSDPMPLVPWNPQTAGSIWDWVLLPKDTIYPFYLADEKSSRMAGTFAWPHKDHAMLDAVLGGRVGVMRMGDSCQGAFRRGVQLDIEGSAQLRLDLRDDVDLRSVDFRAGVPISFGFGRLHTRLGYYHLSSHIGDEYLLKHPNFNRLNYSRDVLYAGVGYWITHRLRVYGEAGWAFHSDIAQEWEFGTGIEYVPTTATGWRGAPYGAIHANMREELNYGGSINMQAGWAWRGEEGGLFRIGAQYHEGKSWQWSFYDRYEPTFSVGIWYDL